MAVAKLSLMQAGFTMTRILKFGFILLVMLIGLAFHLRNNQPVDLNYYLGVVSLPFSLYVIASLCVGALLGGLVVLPRLLWLKQENARLRKRLQVNEKELNNLRVIPVKDTH
jgi:putative membrane protein